MCTHLGVAQSRPRKRAGSLIVDKGSKAAPRLDLNQPQNHVAVALAGSAHGGEAVDDRRFEPNQPLALGV